LGNWVAKDRTGGGDRPQLSEDERAELAREGELFDAWRYHAVFTDSPQPMLEAERTHRQHAIVEQVITDLKSGPLTHLPSGRFTANSAWRLLAAMAFNLTRAAGALASAFHARATTGTIRAQLIAVPARLARSARRLRLHLPRAWPWEQAWTQMFDQVRGSLHRIRFRSQRPQPPRAGVGAERHVLPSRQVTERFESLLIVTDPVLCL
jgi:hypothetical protein